MNNKLSSLSKFIGAGLIAASLVVAPITLPVHAQNTAPGTTGTTTQQDGRTDTAGLKTQATERDNNDWGWLGLLGLIGLAGLAKKKRTENVHTVGTEPNVGARSTSDYR
ncbi:MAG TPA: WGxxGxxG family protein [Coleofasciculaceae cyanobacterium]|jgi:hypothetical protein